VRILFVEPGCDRQGHYGVYTVSLCQALAELQHEVILCTNKVHPELYIREPALFHVVEVKNGNLSFERLDELKNRRPIYYSYGYLRNSFFVFKAALELARLGQFDVIHLTGTEFMVASLLLKRYAGNIPPVIIEIQAANFSFGAYPGPFFLRFYKVVQREVFRTTLQKEIRGIAVIGEFQKEKLKSQLRFGDDLPISVIPNAGSIPTQQLEKAAARKSVGLGDYPGTVFLFFGHIRKDKGIEYLLEAVSLLKSRDFRLLIAGAPRDYTEDRIRSLVGVEPGGTKIIVKLGYVPEGQVPLYFYACDALVLPYPKVYTGGSGPLVRGACSHHRASIVTDVSDMGRLARTYGLGLVAEPENPSSLAGKLEEFMQMPPARRQDMADRALAFAEQSSWRVMAERFTDLYKAALQGATRV